MLRVIAISGLLAGLVPGVARGAWMRPVRGPVVERFAYSSHDRFAAGQQRGIVLAAHPGEPVLAACPGHVIFAGSVGRAGPTVSVDCGPLRATYQGLAETGIEQGASVRAGDVIGLVGEAGAVHVGAREGPGRYIDPARLFGAARRPPLGPAPPARRPRAPEPTPPAALARQPQRRPHPTAPPRPAPLAAWLGLALLAVVAPTGALARRRHRRRAGTRRTAPAIT